MRYLCLYPFPGILDEICEVIVNENVYHVSELTGIPDEGEQDVEICPLYSGKIHQLHIEICR